TVPANGGRPASAVGSIARSFRVLSGATGSRPTVEEDVESPSAGAESRAAGSAAAAASRASGVAGGSLDTGSPATEPVVIKPATTRADIVIGAEARIRPHQPSSSWERPGTTTCPGRASDNGHQATQESVCC